MESMAQEEGARSGHAPDPQGPAVVLWHEDAHRRGQPHGSGAQRGGDGGQRARQTPTARSAGRGVRKGTAGKCGGGCARA